MAVGAQHEHQAPPVANDLLAPAPQDDNPPQTSTPASEIVQDKTMPDIDDGKPPGPRLVEVKLEEDDDDLGVKKKRPSPSKKGGVKRAKLEDE